MISENQQLIRKDVEKILKNIKEYTNNLFYQNEQIKLNQYILFDYYNLITNNIYDKDNTTYILHLISREINKSNSLIEQKSLLTLLNEFFTPFLNEDISLTYPYLNRILTTIQSNIMCNISPIYIGEIFKKIIFSIFNNDDCKINKELFEICQGFCLYNMKLKYNNNKLVGIICLNILLNEINYSFLNQKNFVSYIWEKIVFYLDDPNFIPKDYLLKYLYDFISKFKVLFQPFVNIAIYKILEFFENNDENIRKFSLNILGLLISFYPKEIEPIKQLILKLLLILNIDKNENIRNKSIYIYNKLKNQYKLSNKINKHKKNKLNFYFYDLSYNLWFKQKENKLNITGNGLNFKHKKFFSRNSSLSNFNFLKDGLKQKTAYSELYNSASESEINIKLVNEKNIENENNENKKENIEKLNNIKKNIGFKELLNFVKDKNDNKFNNDFTNLRNFVKNNKSGLLHIRKINPDKNI